MIKNKKILITGGAGFTGYHLSKKIVLDNKITILDNLQRGRKDKYFKNLIKFKNVKFINLDLTKKIDIKKNEYDYVFLLASIVGVKNVNDQPYSTLKVNIQSTFNTLDILNSKKTKLIYFSTSEVYSPLVIKKINKFPINEKKDLLILSQDSNRFTYYISKILGEKLIKFSGKPFLILRPHNIYGPRMGYSHVIPEQIYKIKNKKKSLIYSPNHKRAFCYIDDAIDQIMHLCSSRKNFNKIFNIGNPKEPITMMKLSKLIKNELKLSTKLLPTKITSGSISNRIPFLNKSLYPKCKTSLKKGVINTIKWYQENENI